MKGSGIVLFTLAALAGCGRKPPHLPTDARSVKIETQTNARVSVSDLKPTHLLLVLSANKTSIVQGESVAFTERLQNIGTQPIYENFRSFYRTCEIVAEYYETLHEENSIMLRLDGVKMKRGDILRGRSHFVPSVDVFEGFPGIAFTSHHNATTINPGSFREVSYSFRLPRAGVYQFQAEWSSNYSTDHQDDLWRGKISSNALTLDVKPNKELFDKAEALKLILRPNSSAARPGDLLRITGLLTNAGPTEITIGQNLCSLQVTHISPDKDSPGREVSKERKTYGNPSLVVLKPGATLELSTEERLPETTGSVQVQCGLRVFIQINESIMGATVYATDPLEIMVSKDRAR